MEKEEMIQYKGIQKLNEHKRWNVSKFRIRKASNELINILFISILFHYMSLVFPIIGNFFNRNTLKINTIDSTFNWIVIFSLLNFGYYFIIKDFKKNLDFTKKTVYLGLFLIFQFSLFKAFFLLLILIPVIFSIEEIFIYRENTEKERGKEIELEPLYDSRKLQLNYLVEIINPKKDSNKKLILIDGKWGIGKNHFIGSAFHEIGEHLFYKVNIDILLFNNKEHIIEYAFNEIRKILEEEGIRGTALKELKSIMRVVTESYRLKISNLFDDDRLEKVEKELTKEIEKLEKPLFIVVDNLERVLDENKIVDTLGFLHKLNDILTSKCKIIILADSDKIKNLPTMGYDYLDKFFDEKIFLIKIEKNEIIDGLKEYIKEKPHPNSKEISYDVLENAVKEFEDIKEKILGLNYDENANNYFQKRIMDINNKLENSRNIKKIIDESYTTIEIFKDYNENNEEYEKKLFIKQVLLANILNKFFLELPHIYITKNDLRNHIFYDKKNKERHALKESEYDKEFVLNYFGLSTELSGELSTRKKELILSNYYRLIKGDIDTEEKLASKMGMSCKYDITTMINTFLYHINFLSNNYEENENKYKAVLEKCKGKLINPIEIDSVLNDENFLKFEKQFYNIDKDSIYFSLDFTSGINNTYIFNLIDSYFDELYLFAYNNLGYRKNIVRLENKLDLYKIIIRRNRKNSILQKNYNKINDETEVYKYLIEYIKDLKEKKYNIEDSLIFLCIKINKIEELNLKRKKEDTLTLKIDEYLHLQKQQKNLNIIQKEKKVSQEIIEIIYTDIENLFMENLKDTQIVNKELPRLINMLLIDYIKRIPTDFYFKISNKLGILNMDNQDFIWRIDVFNILIHKELNSFFQAIDSQQEKITKLDIYIKDLTKQIQDSETKEQNIQEELKKMETYLKNSNFVSNNEKNYIAEKLRNKQNELIVLGKLIKENPSKLTEYEEIKKELKLEIAKYSERHKMMVTQDEMLKRRNLLNENYSILQIQVSHERKYLNEQFDNINQIYKSIESFIKKLNIDLNQYNMNFRGIVLKSIFDKIEKNYGNIFSKHNINIVEMLKREFEL